MTQEIVTRHIAHVLASRLTAQGYQVDFPPGRDPAAFMVVSLRAVMVGEEANTVAALFHPSPRDLRRVAAPAGAEPEGPR
jgi:hypothetical protein